MRNLLIGSRALNYWVPEMKLRATSDWDIISDRDIEWAEVHAPNLLDNYELDRYASDDCYIDHNGIRLYVVDPVGLGIVKRSHLWRNLNFQKHITHYHNHLAVYRGRYTLTDIEYLNRRTRLTHLAYPQGNPKLNQPVKDFFDDAVEKKYDHDWVHQLVAYDQEPMYLKLQRDKSSAWCDKDLWSQLSIIQQTQCVVEEATVIAIERYLVPTNWRYPKKLAFIKSVDRVCTTLCSGWFRDFAIDNYPKIIDMYDSGRFDKIQETIYNTEKVIHYDYQ